MRVVSRLCCLLAALGLLCVPARSVDGAEKVRISVTNLNISFLPAGAALKKGFFKDEGLDVEIIRMNTPNSLTALITGDIGYTLLFGSVVRGALRGMPIRAVASLLDSPTHALIAKAEYKSVKDLKGKTVGIGNFGGTDEVVARLMFKAHGVDAEKDLKFIAVGSDRARLAAIKENLVDVAVIAPPGIPSGSKWGLVSSPEPTRVSAFPSSASEPVSGRSRNGRKKSRRSPRLCCGLTVLFARIRKVP